MEIDQIDPVRCAKFIQETAPKFAKAKADRTFIENYLRTVKSQLMGNSDATSLGQREADAYASQKYVDQLNGLREAVELEETFRWQMTAAQAKLEIWKVCEYSKRQEMRNLG